MELQEPTAGQEVIVEHVVNDPCVNIAVDTIKRQRQLLVFVNTKRGAESQAEKISTKFEKSVFGEELSKKVLGVLSKPTKQCKRLARCILKGSAFHHAGLHAKQKEIVEDAFREGKIKVICSTPTLAIGLDLPAFRVIIRDLKRYGGPWGMTAIPVLEYLQQAGRAGRPGKDPWGEAICIAKDSYHADEIIEQYIKGEPESIYSKLAVEPVLRTYVLSLVASEFVTSKEALLDFFSQTFYAHQYGDMQRLATIIEMIIEKLTDWEFLKGSVSKQDDFSSASELLSETKKPSKLRATPLGKRVSEHYLDPYTAFHIIKGLRRSTHKVVESFGLIHLFSSCLELRPYLKVKMAEIDMIGEKLAVEESRLLHIAPTRYSDEYDIYLDTIKTAMLFEAWTQEKTEEEMLEVFAVRPGELHAKLQIIDWIVYAASEISRLLSFHEQRAQIMKLRVRLKHGAKEELLGLLKLRNIGRVRARKLYNNKIKNVLDVQRADFGELSSLVGRAVATTIKGQVGQKVDPQKVQVKPNKRKGQISLGDW